MIRINKEKKRMPCEKEWEVLLKKEQRLLEKRKEKKETAFNRLLAEKVPEKLQHTLDIAFEKAFHLIFEKGTGIIEKTYQKDKMEKEFKVNLYADQIYGTRKTLRKFSQKAGQAGARNLATSGVAGVGMGLLGIGLPDIPIFTGMILRCIYEIAINYGFNYKSESEKYFILLLIEGAVSYGGHLEEVEHKIEGFMNNSSFPADYVPEEQISRTSRMLSRELLYMKFLQGIPVVGAVGGAYDAIYMKQIAVYAKLKYQKRFLIKYRK